jgi:hypothetical protein
MVRGRQRTSRRGEVRRPRPSLATRVHLHADGSPAVAATHQPVSGDAHTDESVTAVRTGEGWDSSHRPAFLLASFPEPFALTCYVVDCPSDQRTSRPRPAIAPGGVALVEPATRTGRRLHYIWGLRHHLHHYILWACRPQVLHNGDRVVPRVSTGNRDVGEWGDSRRDRAREGHGGWDSDREG